MPAMKDLQLNNRHPNIAGAVVLMTIVESNAKALRGEQDKL